ncbi:CHAT domain-containing protein [Streptomyces polyrhachis]|uniref:CHAT domain-containing protein n=1 Tax=Streptomyces polyrhachis TaxID=1282885 RepID=A0ABW2G7Y6_9ACTN
MPEPSTPDLDVLREQHRELYGALLGSRGAEDARAAVAVAERLAAHEGAGVEDHWHAGCTYLASWQVSREEERFTQAVRAFGTARTRAGDDDTRAAAALSVARAWCLRVGVEPGSVDRAIAELTDVVESAGVAHAELAELHTARFATGYRPSDLDAALELYTRAGALSAPVLVKVALLLAERFQLAGDAESLYQGLELTAQVLVNPPDGEQSGSAGTADAAGVFAHLLRQVPRSGEAGARVAETLSFVIGEAHDPPAARQFLAGALEYVFQDTGSVTELRALLDLVGDAPGEPGSDIAPLGIAAAWLRHSAQLLRGGTLGLAELDGVVRVLAAALTDTGTPPSALDALAVGLARAVAAWTTVNREPTVGQLDTLLTRTEAAAGALREQTGLVLALATAPLYLKRSNRSELRGHMDATVEVYEFLHERLDGREHASLKVTLAHAHESRYERFGLLPDLERSVVLLDEALAAGEDDPALAASMRASLAASLLRRFGGAQEHTAGDWYRAAELLEAAVDVEAVEAVEAQYAWLRNGLAQEAARLFAHGTLLDRAPSREWRERLHRLQDRARTLADAEDLVGELGWSFSALLRHFDPSPDPERPALPDAALADQVAHVKRALTTADVAQVHEADGELRRRLARIASGEDQLRDWAGDFASRYESGRAVEDLCCAIAALRARTRLAGETTRLADLLTARYETAGLVSDLDEAVALLGGLLSATPGRVQRCRLLNNLSGALWRRFQHTGLAADLDSSVEAMRAALELTPADSDHRARYLSNLAGKLDARFVALGSRSDLDEVIALSSQAERAAGTEQPEIRYSALNGLGGAYRRRYQLDSDAGDIRLALDTLEAALAVLAPDDPARPGALTNLAACILVGLREPAARARLDEAVTMLRTATAATGAHDPVRAGRYFLLAQALLIKAGDSPHPPQRAEALAILRSLVPDNRVDHPHQIEPAEALALELSAEDPRTARALSRDTARALFARAPARITAARRWAALAAAAGDVEDALTAWETVLDLFDLVAWRGKPRPDQEESLAEHQGVAGGAAAYAISVGRPARAVELLERGRSVLWNQVSERRADTSDELDTRLRTIAEDLRQAAGVDERVRLGREWDRLKAEAAARYGAWNPFAAPTYEELRRGAGDTTVVVNVAPQRSDALVLADGEPRVIELPGLEFAETARRAAAFLQAAHAPAPGVGGYLTAQRTAREVLDWLWHAVAHPVLDALDPLSLVGDARRIRWCPTGMLSLLPLHAATDAATGESALERAVSSYTPSLRATTAARPGGRVERMLTVGVADYLEHPPLAGVDGEIEAVRRLLPQARHTTLVNAKATVRAVRAALPGNPCVHFACHGIQDLGAPSGGGVVLADGTLSVLDLASLRFTGAELAYLSACRTATGGTRLPDESLHLAGALHLAGFRQVVGTLWAVRDTLAAEVAEDFYTEIGARGLDAAADAVAGATRRLRARYPLEPLLWAAFVHMG